MQNFRKFKFIGSTLLASAVVTKLSESFSVGTTSTLSGGLIGPRDPFQMVKDQRIVNKHYDVAVIGGGSAGLGFAYEASKHGLNVVLFDYVIPSPHGTKWGLGGTCVNVGCIPKKLMHHAALLSEDVLAASDYGYNFGDNFNQHSDLIKEFHWKNLITNIQSYIKSLNFGYRTELLDKGVTYLNALATLHDKNTIVFSPSHEELNKYLLNGEEILGKTAKITADYIVLAGGGRPNLLADEVCRNSSKYSITSDDIFSLKKAPGKTLIVGGGYIALETAGLLSSLGNDVTLMTRAKYLKEFDEDVSNKLIEYMHNNMHIKIHKYTLPYDIEKLEDGKFKVKWKHVTNLETSEDIFDTIIMAVGRTASTKYFNLDKVGVKINNDNKKIKGGFNNEIEQTSVPNIYALGDNLDGIPELTPVAAKSGQFLARRIDLIKKGISKDSMVYKKNCLQYEDICTTIFTPLEYSSVGYNEANAIKKYGNENIEIYHSIVTPLEEGLVTKMDENGNFMKKKSYFKIICNKIENNKVVGMHYLGKNAGEIMQGFGVAMKAGLTKELLDQTVGIHPTVAEEFVNLKVTKASGENPEKTSC